MSKKCFECGNNAQEEHHIIPKVLGGDKTVPLCSKCHGKVHAFGKRRDNFKALQARGIDKQRVWQLWASYHTLYVCDMDEDLAKSILEGSDLSVGQFNTSLRRFKEEDADYFFEFFTEHGCFKRYFKENFQKLKD